MAGADGMPSTLGGIEGLALASLDALPEASVMAFDTDLRYVIVRGQALRRHGFKPEGMEGRLCAEALSPDRWALYEPLYRAALKGETSSTEVLSPDGERSYSVQVGPLQGCSGEITGGVAIATDITQRLHAEESRARLAAIVESSNDAIVYVSLEGVVLTWNAGAERLTRYTADEMIGRAAGILGPPDRLDETLEVIGRVRRGERAEPFETIRLRKDGRCVDVSVSVSPVMDGSGNLVALSVVTRDISERKRVERDLEASEERSRGIFENVAEGIYQSSPDGQILMVNPALAALLGYESPEELLSTVRNVGNLYLDANRRSELLRVLETEDVVKDFEAELWRKDGTAFLASMNVRAIRDEEGKIDHLDGVMIDVTGQRQAEDALLRHNAIFKATAFAAERFLRASTWEDCIQEVLAHLGDAVGVARVRIARRHAADDGTPLVSVLHEWSSPDMRAPADPWSPQNIPFLQVGFGRWFDALIAGGTIHGRVRDFPACERPLLEAQGILSCVEVPIFVEEEGWGFLGFDECRVERDWSPIEIDSLRVAADVLGATISRNQAEAALGEGERRYAEAYERERRAADELRDLDAMKTTFLQATSHELRTPLTSILGFALTLERQDVDIPPEDRKDMLRRLAANARKLEHLVLDLLDLDRLVRGTTNLHRTAVDVGTLTARALEWVDLAGHPLRTELEPVIAPVDVPKVERIVENLVTNAVRHTPPRCPIWVRVRQQGGSALIIVEDAGSGVPDDSKESVFEPFREVMGGPGYRPGVGVGLSLVKQFAKLHGGNAWVEDRPGGGASFRVLLPSVGGGAKAVA